MIEILYINKVRISEALNNQFMSNNSLKTFSQNKNIMKPQV